MSPQQLKLRFHPLPFGSLEALWSLAAGGKSVKVSLSFTPTQKGQFSLGYPHHSSLFFGCDMVNGGIYWQVLAATDFFTVEPWRGAGLIRYHVLFVIRLATREVQIAAMVLEPNEQWIKQVTRNPLIHGPDSSVPADT